MSYAIQLKCQVLKNVKIQGMKKIVNGVSSLTVCVCSKP